MTSEGELAPCESLFTVASIRQSWARLIDEYLRGGYVGVELVAVAGAHLGSYQVSR